MRPTEPSNIGYIMKLSDLLGTDDVLVDLRVAGKKRLLAELATHAARRVGVAPDVIVEALVRREELGSTGMGDGIGIPHARLADVAEPFGALVRLRPAIEFDAVDNGLVDLAFLLLLPAAEAGKQLNALACVARRLRDPTVASALRSAKDPAQLRDAFVGADRAS